jgi:hypothetical protein
VVRINVVRINVVRIDVVRIIVVRIVMVRIDVVRVIVVGRHVGLMRVRLSTVDFLRPGRLCLMSRSFSADH